MGAVILIPVHVFKGVTGRVPHPQIAAGPSPEDRPEEAGHSFAEALAQLSVVYLYRADNSHT
jgi:hypothetical protein